jgi:hypothetical protein
LWLDEAIANAIALIVQTDNNYNQVLTWSLASRFDTNNAELASVAEGFSEIK